MSELGPTLGVLISLASLAAITLAVGCSAPAQSRVYRQEMADEIRNLEDQLYEADYHNRVLEDRLERYERKLEQSKIEVPRPTNEPPSLPAPVVPNRRSLDYAPLATPVPDPMTDGDYGPYPDRSIPGLPPEPLSDQPNVNSMNLDTRLEDANPDAVSPEESDAPRSDNATQGRDDVADEVYDDLTPPEIDMGEVDPELSDGFATPTPDPQTDVEGLDSPTGDEVLPPPPNTPPVTAPRPPSMDDLRQPDILPGDPQPPTPDVEVEPKNKIELPPTLLEMQTPTSLRIDRTRTRPRYVDGRREGIDVIVEAINRRRLPVDLRQFDIDAEVLVTATFEDQRSKTRTQQYRFSEQELTEMISEDGRSIQLPLAIAEEVAESDSVQLTVELDNGEASMVCKQELNLTTQTAIEDWTPRG